MDKKRKKKVVLGYCEREHTNGPQYIYDILTV